MRLRADVPGIDASVTEILVEVTSHNAGGSGPGPGPTPGAESLQIVEEGNVENLVESASSGDRLRLRADLPDISAGVNEIRVEISS